MHPRRWPAEMPKEPSGGLGLRGILFIVLANEKGVRRHTLRNVELRWGDAYFRITLSVETERT